MIRYLLYAIEAIHEILCIQELIKCFFLLLCNQMSPLHTRNLTIAKKTGIKLHTIHLREASKPFVFHIHEDYHAPSKSFLICFKDLQNAKEMVHILQTHYRIHGNWPTTHVYPNEPLELSVPRDIKDTIVELKDVPKIHIRTWNSENLEEYMLKYLFNLFKINPDHTAELFSCEFEPGLLQEHFENYL